MTSESQPRLVGIIFAKQTIASTRSICEFGEMLHFTILDRSPLDRSWRCVTDCSDMADIPFHI